MELVSKLFDLLVSEAGAVAGILLVWVVSVHWQLNKANKRIDALYDRRAEEQKDVITALNGISLSLELLKERIR